MNLVEFDLFYKLIGLKIWWLTVWSSPFTWRSYLTGVENGRTLSGVSNMRLLVKITLSWQEKSWLPQIKHTYSWNKSHYFLKMLIWGSVSKNSPIRLLFWEAKLVANRGDSSFKISLKGLSLKTSGNCLKFEL